MLGRNGRVVAALGGLVAVAFCIGLGWWTWLYISPENPRIAAQEASEAPPSDYQPGGAACQPKRLNALPAEKAQAERDRCASAAEDHRVQQAELSQARRANDLAEWNLRLTAQQARSATVQTLATVAAFVAAALAAVFAGLAAIYAGASAKADNLALRATRRSARDAREEAAAQAERFNKDLKISEANLGLARQAAAEADRAWMRVTVTPKTGLIIDDETVAIEAEIAVENVGKGPAIGVRATAELTFDLVELDQKIRNNTNLRALAGRLGRIMFPGDRYITEGRISIERKALTEAVARDKASKEPMGAALPAIAAGCAYSLPGDNATRLSYTYLYLAKKKGARLQLYGEESGLDLADMIWEADALAGPIT